MYRNDDEKLTDIMLGEAVLALLHGGGCVTNSALVAQLQAMYAVESDENKKNACQRAIEEVRDNSHARRVAHKVRDRDNIRHYFNNDGPADDTKKH